MNPFEIAKQKRLEQEEAKKREEEDKKNRNYSKDYEEIQFMGLTDKPKVFRLIGNPVEARELPTDPKIVFWSKIINDSGKNWMHIYWPTTPDDEIDKDWILYRLYNKVMESKWIDYKEGDVRDPNKPKSNEKGYYLDLHTGKTSHTRIDKNAKEGSKQFGHFYPKKRIVFNVIDKMDDWCVENKHSKMLSSSHSPFDIQTEQGPKTIFFTDVGIPNELYKVIWSQVIEFRASWDFDLIVHKEDKKYIVRDAFEDKIKEEVKKLVNANPLTDLEKQYELYDLNKLYAPSGYYKLYNGLEKLFKQVDSDLGTLFFHELKEFYEVEKVEREKAQKAADTSQHSTGSPSEDSEPGSTEHEAQEEKPARRRSEEAPKLDSIEDKLKSLPGWPNLDDQDKQSMIINCTSVEGDNFKFKEGTSLIACSCGKKIGFPEDVFHCPVCPNKVEFE